MLAIAELVGLVVLMVLCFGLLCWGVEQIVVVPERTVRCQPRRRKGRKRGLMRAISALLSTRWHWWKVRCVHGRCRAVERQRRQGRTFRMLCEEWEAEQRAAWEARR